MPDLPYGSETLTLKEPDKSRITATETKSVRKIAKCVMFYNEINEDVLNKT